MFNETKVDEVSRSAKIHEILHVWVKCETDGKYHRIFFNDLLNDYVFEGLLFNKQDFLDSLREMSSKDALNYAKRLLEDAKSKKDTYISHIKRYKKICEEFKKCFIVHLEKLTGDSKTVHIEISLHNDTLKEDMKASNNLNGTRGPSKRADNLKFDDLMISSFGETYKRYYLTDPSTEILNVLISNLESTRELHERDYLEILSGDSLSVQTAICSYNDSLPEDLTAFNDFDSTGGPIKRANNLKKLLDDVLHDVRNQGYYLTESLTEILKDSSNTGGTRESMERGDNFKKLGDQLFDKTFQGYDLTGFLIETLKVSSNMEGTRELIEQETSFPNMNQVKRIVLRTKYYKHYQHINEPKAFLQSGNVMDKNLKFTQGKENYENTEGEKVIKAEEEHKEGKRETFLRSSKLKRPDMKKDARIKCKRSVTSVSPLGQVKEMFSNIHLQTIIPSDFLERCFALMKRPSYLFTSGHPLLLPKVRNLTTEPEMLISEYMDRLYSFILGQNERNRTWDDNFAVRPGPLIDAGFSYSGDGYKVLCNHCGYVSNVSEWPYTGETDFDLALSIHRQTSTNCHFLRTYNEQRHEKPSIDRHDSTSSFVINYAFQCIAKFEPRIYALNIIVHANYRKDSNISFYTNTEIGLEISFDKKKWVNEKKRRNK